MKNKLSWGIALLPFVPSVWMQGQEQKQGIGNRRPNIIFIMSDDHARQAMSIYGHPIGKIAPTPHIDRIGHEGAVFQNNYCCNSISGPSRAAILTGKHSHKNGFMRNGNKGFDGSQQTLPKILQANGYETAIIGKWHLASLKSYNSTVIRQVLSVNGICNVSRKVLIIIMCYGIREIIIIRILLPREIPLGIKDM